MFLPTIKAQEWILAMFIRDDGQRLLLGDGNYDFNEEQLHFAADVIQSDVVEIQGANGQLMAGQVRRSAPQSFDGYIGDGITSKAETEAARRNFINYFQQDHHYDVVYISCPRSDAVHSDAIIRRRGYLVDAPEVKEIYQHSPSYHVALAFEDVRYFSYNEDDEGHEIPAGREVIEPSGETSGGWVWDGKGAVWDAQGGVWDGSITDKTKKVVSLGVGLSPLTITIKGRAVNPLIQNLTTKKGMLYDGTLEDGQVLILDSETQTAKLDGESVLQNIHGDWLELQLGENLIKYSAESDFDCELTWEEVIE